MEHVSHPRMLYAPVSIMLCLLFRAGAALAAEDEATLYLYGTPSGCLVQLQTYLQSDESLRWQGECPSEFATGPGTLSVVDRSGEVLDSGAGVMANGILVSGGPRSLLGDAGVTEVCDQKRTALVRGQAELLE